MINDVITTFRGTENSDKRPYRWSVKKRKKNRTMNDESILVSIVFLALTKVEHLYRYINSGVFTVCNPFLRSMS